MMLEVEKMSQNSTEKQDVDIAESRPSPRLPALLHVHFHQTLKSRRAFTKDLRFVCYDFAAKD